MLWIVLTISLTTLLVIPLVALRAYELKRQIPPTSFDWLLDYLHALYRLRRSLYVSFGFLGVNALLFFFPSLLGGPQSYLATIFGLIDLLCGIVLYLVWRWAGWLIQRALER